MGSELEEIQHEIAVEPAVELGSGVYVDAENLGSTDAAMGIVKSLIESWPSSAPEPTLLSLYVRADHTARCAFWVEGHFPKLTARIHGVQHFNANQSKNLADIALVMDAVTDFVLGRVGSVVVISDDSDFVSLFTKLKEESDRIGASGGKTPFLWVITDHTEKRSPSVENYFPKEYTYTVSLAKKSEPPEAMVKEDDKELTETNAIAEKDSVEVMAVAIISEIPLGKFKSTECQKVIRRLWPNHKLAKSAGQSFGVEFRKDLWPVLSKFGVIEPNPNKQPRRYEMTLKAKDSIS